MRTIEQTDFDALVLISGSDCWSDGHIVREVLKGIPTACKIEFYPSTRLWVDVKVFYPVENQGICSLKRRVFG